MGEGEEPGYPNEAFGSRPLPGDGPAPLGVSGAAGTEPSAPLALLSERPGLARLEGGLGKRVEGCGFLNAGLNPCPARCSIDHAGRPSRNPTT